MHFQLYIEKEAMRKFSENRSRKPKALTGNKDVDRAIQNVYDEINELFNHFIHKKY